MEKDSLLNTNSPILKDAPFHSEKETNLQSENVNELYDKMNDKKVERLEKFVNNGSGWMKLEGSK